MVKKKVKRKSKSVAVDNVFILVALIVLNVLVILHFWIAIAAAIIGLIAGAFGMIVGGVAGFIGSLVYPFVQNSWMVQHISLGGIHPLAIGILSVAIFCIGGLWMIGNYFIAKYYVKAAKWYFDLNVRAFRKYEP